MRRFCFWLSTHPLLAVLIGTPLLCIPVWEWCGLTLLMLAGLRNWGRTVIYVLTITLPIIALLWYFYWPLPFWILVLALPSLLLFCRYHDWNQLLLLLAVGSLGLLLLIDRSWDGNVPWLEVISLPFGEFSWTRMAASYATFTVLVAAFLARSLQSGVEQPGAFSREFSGLRLSTWHWLSWLLLLALGWQWVGPSLMALSGMPLMLLGGAVLVGTLLSTGWRVLALLTYVLMCMGFGVAGLLAMPSYGIPTIASLLLLDAVFDWRARMMVHRLSRSDS